MNVCLTKLLLVKVSDRDRNVKGKTVGCVKLIVIVIIIYQPKNMFHDTLLVASCFFRHDVGQALRNVCYCDITFLVR